MNAHIILGLGFGDEGKGLMTSYLSQTLYSPLVIRFSGGQQCGHTVVDKKGNRHIFSNFGSGTLDGAPTYWSKYCTFHPNGLLNELKLLKQIGANPIIYVDNLAQVTTPFDIIYNQALEKSRDVAHGSCGVGIGTTVERNLTPYKLYAQDLAYPNILKQKLYTIFNYYQDKIQKEYVTNKPLYEYWCQFNMEDASKDRKSVV